MKLTFPKLPRWAVISLFLVTFTVVSRTLLQRRWLEGAVCASLFCAKQANIPIKRSRWKCKRGKKHSERCTYMQWFCCVSLLHWLYVLESKVTIIAIICCSGTGLVFEFLQYNFFPLLSLVPNKEAVRLTKVQWEIR